MDIADQFPENKLQVIVQRRLFIRVVYLTGGIGSQITAASSLISNPFVPVRRISSGNLCEYQISALVINRLYLYVSFVTGMKNHLKIIWNHGKKLFQLTK